MKSNIIAKRYAKALSGALPVEQLPDEISRLEKLVSIIEGDKKIKGFFINPLFSDQEKRAFLEYITERFNFNEKTKNCLSMLIEEKAFGGLETFVMYLRKYYAQRQRLLKATILSAIPVDGGIVERITNALRNMTQKDVIVVVELDPSILGGIVVRFDNTVYDLSIKGQLNILKNEIIKG